jgi:hypothetical protein
MNLKLIIIFGFAIVLSSCSNFNAGRHDSMGDEVSAVKGPSETSIEFWEKLDKMGYENDIRLLEMVDQLGILETDEARQAHKAMIGRIRAGQTKWVSIFAEVRSKMDPERDILRYYSSMTNQAILILRDGRVREKIALSGEGAWQGTKPPAP